jgi:hypothetical protein
VSLGTTNILQSFEKGNFYSENERGFFISGWKTNFILGPKFRRYWVW